MTNEQNTPIILAEEKDYSRRLVQLEAIHEVDYDGSLSILYTAFMTQGGVTVERISGAEPPTHFYLDFNVIEALCVAWTDFKDAQEAQKQAEEEEKRSLIAKAFALAARHPEIAIEEGKGYWNVSIPSQGYGFCSPAYYPVHLLEQVKTCCGVLQGQETTGGDAA